METISARQGRGIFYMVLCATLWSVAGVLVKQIPWHPLAIAGTRSLLAAGCLLVYMRISRLRLLWNRNVALGAAVLGATFILFITSNKLTTAANAIVLQFTAPIFILLYTALLEKKPLRSADAAVVAVVMLGIGLFFFDQLTPGGMMGNFTAILSGATFGATFFVQGRADMETRMSGIFFAHILTAIVGLPFLLYPTNQFTTASLVCILLLGVFQLGIPYVLFGLALRDCPPFMSSLLTAAEPLLNPLWVFLVTGERPGLFALAGGVLVVVSITLWTRLAGAASKESVKIA